MGLIDVRSEVYRVVEERTKWSRLMGMRIGTKEDRRWKSNTSCSLQVWDRTSRPRLEISNRGLSSNLDGCILNRSVFGLSMSRFLFMYSFLIDERAVGARQP